MEKIGPNQPCYCGSGNKYKKCCRRKDEEKAKIIAMKKRIDGKKITREDFLFNPFTKCPVCKKPESFGLFPLSNSDGYTKECLKCGHRQSYSLPKLNKKIIYLDQFVISNLVKLLDPSHKSHLEIKKDSFWEELFIRLEKLKDANLIVCPDTFYHRDESIAGDIPFNLMVRLYEHFSEGRTLLPHLIVYRHQIAFHFEKWLQGNSLVDWEFNPKNIAWEDFNKWEFGLKISVRNNPREGERDSLLKTNGKIRDGLVTLWNDWASEESTTYKDRVERELLGFKKLLFDSAQQYTKDQTEMIEKAVRGENITKDLIERAFPPMTNDILEDLIHIANNYIPPEEVTKKIEEYLNSAQSLINVPSLKVSCLMYAGLAHRANKSGQKRIPKSLNDVHFISAYLPYCDSMFIDKECATILKEIPKDLPESYKIKYPTKIFSLHNKDEFLSYLDDIFNSATPEHMKAVEDLIGGDRLPYWDIMIHEKAEKEVEAEEEGQNKDL